jgi:diguanylate cyclase (GGDEF)-like protein/PAS domain S-box-containing protein
MRGSAPAQKDSTTDVTPTAAGDTSDRQPGGRAGASALAAAAAWWDDPQRGRTEPRGWGRLVAPFTTNKAKAQSEALRRSEERFRALLQQSSDAVVVVSPDLHIVYATGPVERMLGRCPGDLAGSRLADLVYPHEWPQVEALLTKAVNGPGAPSTQDIRLRRGDNGWLRSQTSVANLLDDENVGGLVLTIRDVSERRALEAQLRQIAFQDPLTGLPNRALFLEWVGEALADRSQASCAVLIIGLNDLRRVNSLGQSAGDQLLQTIADRLQQALGSGDRLARLRGDEFAILVENLTGPDEAVALARRLLVAFQTSVEIEGRSVLPQISIGIATTAPGVETTDEVLSNADVAVYEAKRRGNGCWELFDPAMLDAAVQRLKMEEELRRAIERQEFVVHYQPVVRLSDGSISGVEALVRWRHPERGLVLPDGFLPLAEETGVIIPIGSWMLKQTCRDIAELQRRHGDDRLRVAVNLSSRQFADPSMEEQIAEALADSCIDPTTLVLEITETALMAETEDTMDRMVRLRRLGLSFALDDFGKGYSSLTYLRRYPIQMLKIDRAFIDALADGAENTAIVLAVLSLASTLGMQVVAEGVEQEWQADLLRRLGCTMAQGFYFARPMNCHDLALTLAETAEGRALPLAGASAGEDSSAGTAEVGTDQVEGPCGTDTAEVGTDQVLCGGTDKLPGDKDKVMMVSPLGRPVAGCGWDEELPAAKSAV